MLVFSEYQTNLYDLALDFYHGGDCPKNADLALASEIILSCILQKEGVFSFNRREIQLGLGSFSS